MKGLFVIGEIQTNIRTRCLQKFYTGILRGNGWVLLAHEITGEVSIGRHEGNGLEMARNKLEVYSKMGRILG